MLPTSNLDLGDWGFSALVFPNVRRQTCFRATDGFSAVARFRRDAPRVTRRIPTKTFSHLDQYLCMAFAQLTASASSLRDDSKFACARTNSNFTISAFAVTSRAAIWPMPTRTRPAQIYRDFADALIVEARQPLCG